MSTVIAYIALGSNLGDRLGHMRAAAQMMAGHAGIEMIAASGIYETAPVGGPRGQGPFLNAVMKLRSRLPARELLDHMLAVERSRGRARDERWGPRTLDIDLLVYGEEIIDDPGLSVPHPLIAERNFVLAPLHDLAPDLLIPGQELTVRELLSRAGHSGIRLTQFSL